MEDNNICNGKNSDGAILKKKNRLRKISRGKGYEKGNNQNPSQKKQLWDKHGSGSEISKESKCHFHYSFISIHLLEISECSRIHRTRQNSCPGEKNQRPNSANVQTPWIVAHPPGSSVHGILQARIVEWVAISFSRRSSWPRTRTRVSCIVGRFFTNWAVREAHIYNWICICKRMKLGLNMTPYIKINLKWIKDKHRRLKTIKLLEENTSVYIFVILY